MTARPRFSTVIPARGRPQRRGCAGRSVLFQDYADFAVVAIDNCLNGNTWAEARRLGRVSAIRCPQAGV